MAFLAFTSTGQRWSTTRGWFTPPLGKDRLSFSVLGSLSNGSSIVLIRRIKAEINGISPGAEVPILYIDADYISSRGKTGSSDDFSGLNPVFEYDVICNTRASGDTVSVELL